MNSFIHQGLHVELAAPYEVQPGDGVLKGALFGIARSWAQAGEVVEVSTVGVFDIVRPQLEDWGIGDRIYWNADDKAFTTNAKGGVFIGVAVSESTGADRLSGRVKLIGHAA